LAIWDGETMEADTLVVIEMSMDLRSRWFTSTSMGSRTDASQSIDFKPRMPPMMFSTCTIQLGSSCVKEALTLTLPTIVPECLAFWGNCSQVT